MRSWNAEQRNQIVFTTLITFGLAGLIWFGVISGLNAEISLVNGSITSALLEHERVKTSVREESRYQRELDLYTQQLEELESTMASGDVGIWLLKQNLNWNAAKKAWVDSKAAGKVELETPPPVPYEWHRYSLSGAGFYHDLGSLIATIENSSPFLRVVDLNISTKSSMLVVGATSEEWLAFKLELVGLVNTNTPPAGPVSVGLVNTNTPPAGPVSP